MWDVDWYPWKCPSVGGSGGGRRGRRPGVRTIGRAGVADGCQWVMDGLERLDQYRLVGGFVEAHFLSAGETFRDMCGWA